LVKPVLIVGSTKDPNHTRWQHIAPADPAAWFRSYGAQLDALVARPGARGIDALLLGNELFSMSTNAAHTARWTALISRIRSAFAGRIGYNAGGLIGPFKTSQEYLRVTFIDSLDFIGISAYPRLSAKLGATAADYRKGWTHSAYDENLLKQLNAFLAQSKKEVYLTELGAPATRGGAYFQGRPASLEHDLAQQAAFFDASLDVLATSTGGRLRGVYVYNWHANPGNSLGFAPSAGGAYMWNVYGKPAQRAIQRRFLK